MLTRIKKAQQDREGGFTLIELLVVVIIIGILAAIAIPTFLNQREKAWRRAAMSDLRNAAVVMEENFSDAGTYAGVNDAADFNESKPDVDVTIDSADATGYCLEATHAKLPGVTFSVSSDDGVVGETTC